MIFAAGLGTRLKPFTESHPKALLPLAGKTLLQWQIEKLREAGISEIVVNIHHFGQQIIDYLRENEGFGCKVLISDERDELLETGGGLLKAVELLGTDEPVLVCNVDILSNINLNKLIVESRKSKVESTVAEGARRNSAESRTDEREDLATVVVSERETQRYLLFDGEGVMKGWMNKKTGEYKPQQAENEDLVPLAFSGM